MISTLKINLLVVVVCSIMVHHNELEGQEYTQGPNEYQKYEEFC